MVLRSDPRPRPHIILTRVAGSPVPVAAVGGRQAAPAIERLAHARDCPRDPEQRRSDHVLRGRAHRCEMDCGGALRPVESRTRRGPTGRRAVEPRTRRGSAARSAPTRPASVTAVDAATLEHADAVLMHVVCGRLRLRRPTEGTL
jgi:hypothetical protein